MRSIIDSGAFWDQRIPFLFLSAGRSRVYHTPDDTPDKLDYPKIEATARWLTTFVRAARTRPPTRFVDRSLHRGTLDELAEVIVALAPFSAIAVGALEHVDELRRACDRDGNLPASHEHAIASIVAGLEDHLQ